VIKCLAHQLLKEPNNQVKEVIAAAIGGIGLPEALPCIDSLLKSLEPPSKASNPVDPQVKCMSVWAIGRLASLETIQKAGGALLKML
jgi:HEAT repeat protein